MTGPRIYAVAIDGFRHYFLRRVAAKRFERRMKAAGHAPVFTTLTGGD